MKIISLKNKFVDTLTKCKYKVFKNELLEILSQNSDYFDYGSGYFYQSLSNINLSGLRNSRKRIEAYNFNQFIKSKKILDVGTNTGFLLMERNNFASALGIDHSPNCIEVAKKTKKKLNLKNVDFICGNFLDYKFNRKFDVILSLANHHTFDKGIKNPQHYLLTIDKNLKSKGGVLILESHHPSFEKKEDFKKVETFVEKELFYKLESSKILKTGNYYDDGRKINFYRKNN